MSPKSQRFYILSAYFMLASAVIFFVLFAFKDNVVFFFAPTDLIKKNITANKTIRVGGLVKKGSVSYKTDNQVTFMVTDMKNSISVHYKGILPDLFREGQGVVVHGKFDNKTFYASEVLAKHDENYMPPEIIKSLKESGHWVESYQKK